MTAEHPLFASGHVALHATADINGHKIQATTHARLSHWQADPAYQEYMKADVLRRLAEAIVIELAPEVTITMPPPDPYDALHEALRPFDYPNGELGL